MERWAYFGMGYATGSAAFGALALLGFYWSRRERQRMLRELKLIQDVADCWAIHGMALRRRPASDAAASRRNT